MSGQKEQSCKRCDFLVLTVMAYKSVNGVRKGKSDYYHIAICMM